MTALFGAERDQYPRHRDPHRRGSDLVHARRHQPDADAQADRPGVCHRPHAPFFVRTPTSYSWVRFEDVETAEIAVEAALTGHLLISTLHTNDAPSTIARLTDMDIEPFMISSSILCVCAQRLMRRVCKQCKVQYEPKGREKEILEKAIGWSGPIVKHWPEGMPKIPTAPATVDGWAFMS